MSALANGARGRGGLVGATAAEWTKLWSVRSTWYGLAVAAVLMAGMAAQLALGTVYDNTHGSLADAPGVVRAGQMAVRSLLLVQYAVIGVAMLTITAEYSTGSIRSTLQATPSRGRLVLAKAVVVGPTCLVIGVILAVVGSLVAYPLLEEYGSLPAAGTATDLLVAGGYLALVSLFTTGLGTVLRSAVATLVTVFLLILVLPQLLGTVGIEWLAHVADFLPGGGGNQFMNDAEPYGRWGGLAILGGWVLLTQLVGYVVLRRRDA